MHACRGLALSMVLALLLTGGCVSRDRHVFESTMVRPMTVSVTDALDRETLWSLDVPPEHRLTVNLARGGDMADLFRHSDEPATHMDWALHHVGDAPATASMDGRRRAESGRVQLEGRLIRIDVDYHSPARRERTHSQSPKRVASDATK